MVWVPGPANEGLNAEPITPGPENVPPVTVVVSAELGELTQ